MAESSSKIHAHRERIWAIIIFLIGCRVGWIAKPDHYEHGRADAKAEDMATVVKFAKALNSNVVTELAKEANKPKLFVTEPPIYGAGRK